MSNLLKLSALASVCLAMIVFGACGGGGGGGGGKYSGGGNTDCAKKAAEGGGNPASCTSSGTNTSVNVQYTVTNGITYFKTGTDTNWQVWTGASTSTSTQTN